MTTSGTETCSGRLLRREKLQVVDPDFRVQVPADAVQVGQGQRLFESVLEHAPKAFLEFFRVGVLQHLVLANQQATWQHPFGYVIRRHRLDLLAGNVRQYHAIPIRADQLPLVLALFLLQIRIALEHVYGMQGTFARLFDGIDRGFQAAGGLQFNAVVVDAVDRAQLPVLDFQEQQAALRMYEDEVRITPPLSHRYVVEAQPVVVEQRLQAMR